MRTFASIVAVMLIAAQARADFTLTPASYLETDREVGPIDTLYTPAINGKVIGQGFGGTRTHYIVAIAHFDLTGVSGTISGLELSGALENFGPILLSGTYQTYASMGVGVTLAGSYNAADSVSVYNAATTGSSIGGFSVSNGLSINPSLQPNYPSTFDIILGSNAVVAAQSATSLDIGFVVGSETSDRQSLEADFQSLTLQVSIAPVPEPSSFGLLGASLAAGLVLERKRRRSRR